MATAEHRVPDLAESSLANPWIWHLAALGLTTVALLWLRLGGEESALRLLILLLGLLAAGIGVRFTLRAGRSRRLEVFGSVRAESATLLALCGVVALLGCWALWYGNDNPEPWDTLRLFLVVVAVLALLAAPLLLLPPRVQKIVASLLILFHFGGILTAVTTSPPGSLFMQSVAAPVFVPYLDFLHLTNAYRFYSPEPGPACQLWCRLVYSDDRGFLHSRWIKLPDSDGRGEHGYLVALQNQRRQSLVDNLANSFATTRPHQLSRAWRDAESDKPPPILLGKPLTPKLGLKIPYYSDPRFPEDQDERFTQYQEPTVPGKELLQSFARHLARLPYPNHPEYRFKSVKIYRALHRMLSAPALGQGADPYDITFFVPYFQGEFDEKGTLLNPDDPFLYWVVPIMREHPAEPNSRIMGYVFLHAGDKQDWIKNAAGRTPLAPP